MDAHQLTPVPGVDQEQSRHTQPPPHTEQQPPLCCRDGEEGLEGDMKAQHKAEVNQDERRQSGGGGGGGARWRDVQGYNREIQPARETQLLAGIQS